MQDPLINDNHSSPYIPRNSSGHILECTCAKVGIDDDHFLVMEDTLRVSMIRIINMHVVETL